MYDENYYEPDNSYSRREMVETRRLNRDKKLYVCPDCGQKRLTAYQRAHGYHCDTCTRNVETSGGIYGF